MTRRLARSTRDPTEDDDVVSLTLRLKQLEEDLREIQGSICRGLEQILELRNLGSGHTARITEVAARIAIELGLSEDEQQAIQIACSLHDIGKIGIPDELLQQEGPLSAEQWAEMRRHPEYGWAILRLLPGLEEVSLYVLHHHERWDGSGYPGGLAGTQIPTGARLVAIVDAFDAMVSPRSHKPGLLEEEALRQLRASAGVQFDPNLVETFCRVIETGSPMASALPSLDARRG